MKTKTPWNVVHVPKGMTIKKAYAMCQKKFDYWYWTDDNLDRIVTSDRTTEKAYTVEFAPNVEADKQYKNMSADDLKKKGIKGITLLERLLLELNYFEATGKHLDVENITLCSGSRDSDGSAPSCDWCFGSFRVGWYRPSDADSHLRAREVVSLVFSNSLPSPTLPDRLEINGIGYVREDEY